MLGIGIAGFGLGWMADYFGRAIAIRLGLSLFALSALVIVLVNGFDLILAAIFIAGLAIGIFKTGALALVAELSPNSVAYTSTMNLLEGFFGVGAIVGPLLIAVLLKAHLSWRGLYVVAAMLCVVLIGLSFLVQYPKRVVVASDSVPTRSRSLWDCLMDPYVLGFSIAAFLYVAIECSIYVWMPTLLKKLSLSWIEWSTYALPAFFIMRAFGRFLGVWAVEFFGWERTILVAALAILACFVLAVGSDIQVAAVTLPLSGLFMSVLYPTINSKGIGIALVQDQSTVAGVILAFTCLGAALGPWSMAVLSEQTQDPLSGFQLATVIAGVFALLAAWNYWAKPAQARLLVVH
jgi:fucose permease